MNIQERLQMFFQRLEAAPPAASADEAMALVCQLIEQVEEEFCPVPREEPPPGLRFTGRMYPPQADRIWRLKAGVVYAETRRHIIRCFSDGGIRIDDADKNSIVLTKLGKQK